MSLTPETCRQYLDRWFEVALEDPRAGRRYADRGVQLVRELGDPADLRARSLAILGSSYRVAGDLDRADAVFRTALDIYQSISDLPSERMRRMALDEADLHRRLVFLRLEQQRFSEALDSANRAATTFKAAQEENELGRVYAARGLVQLKMGDPSSIHTMSLGLAKINASKSPRDYLGALHNLLLALCTFHPEPEILDQALELLYEARLSKRSRSPSRRGQRRQLLGHRRKTVSDAKARYLQGRILVLLNQHDEARPLLETVLEDLIELGMPLDVAMVSIELAECYLWLSDAYRWPKIEQLAADALRLLAPVPDASEAIAAWRLLLAAIEARSLERIRGELEACRKRLVLGR